MSKKFSPNMLKTFEHCPKKFCYRYVKNINMPVNDDIFEFGKNIHALASYYLRKENLEKMEASLSKAEKPVWKYLKNINYFAFNTIKTEYSLSVKIENYFYGGRLDALLQDDTGKYYILDYKTGAIPKNATYDFQTMIYMLAVSVFFKTENVTFIYLDLKNKKELKIELTPKLISEYKEKLINITRKIEQTDFDNTKKTECNCEYSVICYH